MYTCNQKKKKKNFNTKLEKIFEYDIIDVTKN